ncbi:MAG: ribosomal protein S18-alanine N-acetyltransferase [Vicinamibacterales bacterium]
MPQGAVFVERLETDADLDGVAALEARCFSNPWTREMLARELAQSDVAHVFVLRLPGAPVAAFCSCWIITDELHVNTMAVDFPYRRQGLATRLMRHVMAEAAGRGAVRATLEVRRSNEPARRLYESLGFSVAAVRPRYYTQPEEDALILWCDALETSAIRNLGVGNPKS